MSLVNIEKTITLDVYDHDTTPAVIKTIQMDTGTRSVFAMIQSSRQDYDIGQNATVSLTVLRPDKTKVQITGQPFISYTGTDGTMYGAKAELSDVALAVKGNLKAQFKITSGEQELRTEIFTINNGEALDADDGDWAGDLDGHNLDEMAQDIEDTKAAVSEMESDVSELKEDLTTIPSIKDSDADEGVFDLTDTQGNVILRLADGHVKTQNFNSSALTESGFEWKFSGTDLLLGYGYNDTYDAVMVINVGRANDLLDFAKLCLKPKGTALETLETADLTTVWSSGTDMHGPFQFLVTSNADGYYSESTDPNFTGGNHTVSIDGTAVKSASSKYVHYFADGRPVSSGNGYCNHFEIRWANEVQAYNCVKADGTGRASLTEYHDMIFDGVRFTEDIKLVPSEEITMSLWYGLQTVSIGTSYTNISFVDGTNRQIFASSESNINSGNNTTSGFRAWGNTHAMEMTVDTNIDLGKRPMYTGTKGAFASSSKGYFYIIGSGNTLSTNCEYNLRGSFRFYPVVA